MESSSASTAQDVLCTQFFPTGSFKFPKCSFGAKRQQRSFRSEWCKKYNWLHYDVGKDAACYSLCTWAEDDNKFLANKKRELAFVSTGFTYWKEATTAFEKHQASATHCEALESFVLLPSQIQGDIGEMCNLSHKEEKKINRRMFMHILQNIRFQVCQGLPLRGMLILKVTLFSCCIYIV